MTAALTPRWDPRPRSSRSVGGRVDRARARAGREIEIELTGNITLTAADFDL